MFTQSENLFAVAKLMHGVVLCMNHSLIWAVFLISINEDEIFLDTYFLVFFERNYNYFHVFL